MPLLLYQIFQTFKENLEVTVNNTSDAVVRKKKRGYETIVDIPDIHNGGGGRNAAERMHPYLNLN